MKVILFYSIFICFCILYEVYSRYKQSIILKDRNTAKISFEFENFAKEKNLPLDIVNNAILLISKSCRIPPSSIKTSDKFHVEICPDDFLSKWIRTGTEIDFLLEDLYYEAKCKQIEINVDEIETVEDFIKAFVKVKSK
jgi:hypothetical protein